MTLAITKLRQVPTHGIRLATHAKPPRIPSDVRIRGVNIAPWFPEIGGSDGASVWAAFWRVWNWAGRIQPQIDDAATVGNCVRMFGCPKAVSLGTVTQATYLAQWKQFLDYCVTKGLYVYPCGGDLDHWGSTTYTQAGDLYTAWADLLADYDNVIGVDVVQEARTGQAYSGSENYLALLHHLGSIVRRRSGAPITFSAFMTSTSAWTALNADYPRTPLFDMCDFIDLHLYYDSALPDHATPLFHTPWTNGKSLIIGEFGGLDSAVTSATRTARYAALKDIVVSRNDICGALAWTCWDLNPGDSRTGLFDATRTLRTDISVPFAALPTGYPTAPYPPSYPSTALYPSS